MSPEVLDALTSAFRTGYDLGRENGTVGGIWIGIAVAALLNALIKLVALYWQWRKAAPARKRAADARADFNEFERQQREDRSRT